VGTSTTQDCGRTSMVVEQDMIDDDDVLFGSDKIAEYLGITRRKVCAFCAKKQLRAYKVGQFWMSRKSWLSQPSQLSQASAGSMQARARA
jgi:hypothetical protein